MAPQPPPPPSTRQRVAALAELRQPPEAIASLARAVWSTTAADDATLAELFALASGDEAPPATDGDEGGLQARSVAATAAWVLLAHGAYPPGVLRQFVGGVFLPLAAALEGGSRAGRQLLSQCVELLAGQQAWQLAGEVLDCAHASLRAAAAAAAAGDRLAAQHCASLAAAPQGGGAGALSLQLQLPAPVACQAVELLLAAASKPAAAAGAPAAEQLQSVLDRASGPLLATACELLRSGDGGLRQASWQLLPALLQAAGAQQPSQRASCLRELLAKCLDMLAQPVVPRRMALAVLLQFAGEWELQPPSAAPPTAAAAGDDSPRFWALLRECLVDAEPLNRKRALRLLQLLLPREQVAAQPLWGVLVALYELLDEFTPHLLKAAWNLVSQLQPAAPEFADEDAAADVPLPGGAVKVLGRGTPQQQQQPDAGVAAAAAAEAAGGDGPPGLAFCWVAVIWTRALTHSNLQVQRMALKTLLKRAWPPGLLAQVPPAFLAGVLLPALRSPVHHRAPSAVALTGVAAALQAKHVSSGVDVAALASQLLARYAAAADPHAMRQLLADGLTAAVAEGQDVSTAGLLAVLRALAAAADAAVASDKQLLGGLSDAEAGACVEANLRQLRRVMPRLSVRQGSKYRAAACNQLLAVMAAAAPAGAASLAACARALLDIPAWLLAPGAPVHDAARRWLLGGGSGGSGAWLAGGLDGMWQQYFSSGGDGGGGPAHATAPDYARWRTASDAWLRVVLCCGDDVQQGVAGAVSDLAERLEQLHSRSYLAAGLPDRALIMLGRLLDAANTAARAGAEAPDGAAGCFLQEQALRAAVAAASHAGRLLQDYCRCFWVAPAELCCQPTAGAGARAPPQLGLAPAAWEAPARAEAAAQAAASAAVLLARHAAADRAARQSLLQLMAELVRTAQLLVGKPLPSAAAEAPQGGEAGLLAAAAAATAAEQSRAAAVRVLRHASLGLSRVTGLAPPLVTASLAEQLQPAALLGALLREAQAAAAATATWQPRLAGLHAAGDPLQGWIFQGLDWAAVDAVFGLTAALSQPANGADHAQQQQQHEEEPGRLPLGVLAPQAVVAVFAHGLEALQWSAADESLLHLLRCMRRAWSLIARDGALQAAAVQDLAASGALEGCGADASPLAQLAATLGARLLDLLHATKRRQPLLCSAIVRCLLLPELMLASDDPARAALHAAPDAPLRRFVAAVLQYSKQGSPVLHLVVALRLAACVPLEPRLLGWYRGELQQLLLWGAPPEGAPDARAGLSPEAATEWALMAEPLDPEQQAAAYLTGIAPRAALLTALDQLAAAAGLASPHHGGAEPNVAFAAAAEAAGTGLWEHLMHTALHDPVLSAETPKVGSEPHRAKVRLWQGLAGAAAFLAAPRQRGAAAAAVRDLLAALDGLNAASVKQYQESITAWLLLRHPGLLEEGVLPLLHDVERGGPGTPSHILVAVLAGLHAPPADRARLLPRLARLLLPWTCHHTHAIRVFAQLGVCALLETHPLDSWRGWRDGLGEGGAELLGALARFLDGNAEFARCRRSMGGGMLAWSPDAVTRPAGILTASLLLPGAEGDDGDGTPPLTFEGCPPCLMDRVQYFLAAERAALREATADKAAAHAAAGLASSAASGLAGAGAGAGGASGDYQRKVAPSERAELLADVLGLDGDGGGGAALLGTRRHELIVVASLIDRVPNLAGLARTAEVLGAGALAVSDLRVAKDPRFTTISVTAERWVPLIEVPQAALVGWLLQQKANGYALLGLEQTAESRPLPGFPFPRRAVLVLGREKEGIDAEIIALLDATLEIPQAGVVRSLNVHVSGALAMYEYVKAQAAADAAADAAAARQ